MHTNNYAKVSLILHQHDNNIKVTVKY